MKTNSIMGSPFFYLIKLRFLIFLSIRVISFIDQFLLLVMSPISLNTNDLTYFGIPMVHHLFLCKPKFS